MQMSRSVEEGTEVGRPHNRAWKEGMRLSPEITPTLLNEGYPEGVVLDSAMERGSLVTDSGGSLAGEGKLKYFFVRCCPDRSDFAQS